MDSDTEYIWCLKSRQENTLGVLILPGSLVSSGKACNHLPVPQGPLIQGFPTSWASRTGPLRAELLVFWTLCPYDWDMGQLFLTPVTTPPALITTMRSKPDPNSDKHPGTGRAHGILWSPCFKKSSFCLVCF